MINFTTLCIGGLIFDKSPIQVLTDSIQNINFIDINDKTYSQIKLEVLNKIRHSEHPLIIIGYSTGGLIICKMYSEIHTYIHKIIFINSSAFFLSDKNWHGIKSKVYNKLQERLLNSNFNTFCRYFYHLSAHPIQKTPQVLKTIASFETCKYWLIFIKSHDMRYELSTIIQPVLLLFSEHDAITKQNYSYCKKNFEYKILPDSTHALLDQRQLLTAVLEFINEK